MVGFLPDMRREPCRHRVTLGRQTLLLRARAELHLQRFVKPYVLLVRIYRMFFIVFRPARNIELKDFLLETFYIYKVSFEKPLTGSEDSRKIHLTIFISGSDGIRTRFFPMGQVH